MKKLDKIITITITDNQVDTIKKFCKRFNAMRYIAGTYKKKQILQTELDRDITPREKKEINAKMEEAQDINASILIRYMLVCGCMRWKNNPQEYMKKIYKIKKDMYKEISKENHIELLKESGNRQHVKIPQKLDNELEKMQASLEKPLSETLLHKTNISLITVTQLGIKEQVKKLTMIELANIIVRIELKELRLSWKTLNNKEKRDKKMHMSFFFPNYILLCNLLESCGLKRKEIYYFAVFSLFKTSE